MSPFFMFQPKEAEVFTRLPDAFRKNEHCEWSEANRQGARLDAFLEGPVFDGAGNLYVTDIPFGRIFRITEQGEWELVVEYDGEPNGMKFINDNALLITDYKNGLVILDLSRRVVIPCLSRRNSERFKGVNDLTIDSQGNVYFTDQGQTGLHDPTGRVYRLRPDGKLDLLIDNIPSPNGIVLNPSEDILYIAATRGNSVWRAPLMRDGSVSKVGQFFTSYGPSGPDGLAMDASGNLLIANPGLGYLWVLSPRGEPLAVWKSTVGSSLTNLAIGGPGRCYAYCTESISNTVLRVTLDVPGIVPAGVQAASVAYAWLPTELQP